jgi:hypothetical protein
VKKPDFRAQFRDDQPKQPHVYMGGMATSCGEHPTLPKRHRWSKIREFGSFRDRMCLNCALTKGVDEKGRDS